MLKKDVADALGITSRSLRDWEKKPGFPKITRWDDSAIKTVRAWMEQESTKNSDGGKIDRDLTRAIKAQKLRQIKAAADAAELKNQIATGNLLPLDEYLSFCSEVITLTRDRLRAIPKRVAKSVPKKYQRQLIVEGEREVAVVLDEFARLLERGPAEDA